ncbi:MAG: chitinase [Undibacterium sp.]|nr:chitinase [Undibacterium sp.]
MKIFTSLSFAALILGSSLLLTSCVTAGAHRSYEVTAKPAPFFITEAQFETLFPQRLPFYTYASLVEATKAYPAFGNTGDQATRKREVAAFLANVMHESHYLQAINEQDTSVHGHYCNDREGVPCAPGKQYFGRGPIQLSWNFNYALAGQALGLDLLGDPDMVSREPAVAWKTAIWYWMEIKGPGTVPAHDAIVNGLGFGEVVRSINGVLECSKPIQNIAYQQQQLRIRHYLSITQMLDVTAAMHTPC